MISKLHVKIAYLFHNAFWNRMKSIGLFAGRGIQVICWLRFMLINLLLHDLFQFEINES